MKPAQTGRPGTEDRNLREFQEACRTEAQTIGRFEVKFAEDTLTHAPVVVVYTPPKTDPHDFYRRLYKLADQYQVPAAVVPASAVSGRSHFMLYS